MLLKNTFDQHPSLRYIFEKMQFFSSLGHYAMLNSEMMTDKVEIENALSELEQIVVLLKDAGNKRDFLQIGKNIHLINNIIPTLQLLRTGAVMDDIQLFEIKKSAIYINNIAAIVDKLGLPWMNFSDMAKVIAILDPENTKIPHFYVYSVYSQQLGEVRAAIENCTDATQRESLRFEEQKIEEDVRKMLSDKLLPFTGDIEENILKVAKMDILLAKARLAIDTSSCKPSITGRHCFKNLVNLSVADTLAKSGRRFQPVNISFGNETVLVTGANMGGKSVLLQTVAMAQFLCQFGFFIPAETAETAVYDDVMCSFGDRQSAQSGLSSFAVEILTIDNIIKAAKSGRRVLAVVDELARTTNPDEGRLLVNGFLRTARKLSLTTIVTTHYSGINTADRKLRVRGLQIPENVGTLSTSHISDYMDYSLTEVDDDDVPKEAFAIARLLHVDDGFIDECTKNRY